jgi:uncharacterized protein YbaR (Trm112 family)
MTMVCPKCKSDKHLEYLGSIKWAYDKSKPPVVKMNQMWCRSCKHKWKWRE